MDRKSLVNVPLPWLLGRSRAARGDGLCSWRVVEKFFSMFSRFAIYDDEGCLLITLKYVHEGRALYDEVFSVYGPFSFFFKSFLLRVLGLRVGHDIGRLLCLGFCRSPPWSPLGWSPV